MHYLFTKQQNFRMVQVETKIKVLKNGDFFFLLSLIELKTLWEKEKT